MAFGFRSCGPPIIVQLDITNEAAVRALVENVRPAIIVNAAAYTAVDKAEDDPATAFAVNAAGVAHLVRYAEQCSAHVLHLSTDYVFDGTKPGWYVESDPINPLGVYGRSKAEGERAALLYPRAIVLRTAWVYGALGAKFCQDDATACSRTAGHRCCSRPDRLSHVREGSRSRFGENSERLAGRSYRRSIVPCHVASAGDLARIGSRRLSCLGARLRW